MSRFESLGNTDAEPPEGVRIPIDALDADTLRGVIEEFVTRDGTDLGEAEAKIAQVEAQLRRGLVEVWFDEETRTCNLLPAAH